MLKSNITNIMNNKEKFVREYSIMSVIALVIFMAVIGIFALFSLIDTEIITISNMDALLIEQDGSYMAQSAPENVDIDKESQNSTQSDTQDNTPEYINLGEFRLTAYCSCSRCCGQFANNRPIGKDGNEIVYTASGKIAKSEYTVAADTSVLPYGTIVYINDMEYEVQDCGGAIKGNSIDIYFDSHEAALEFGVQYADVFVEMN